jgi:hypothetical protein
MIKNVTLGADPELFLEINGEIVSAEGLIGGTKEFPKLISETGHAIQEDNVMIEFNIPPSKSVIEFTNNINQVKDYLEALAIIQGGKLNISASAELDPKYLQSEQALQFGCEPDYNLYLKAKNYPPITGGTLRTCGGHIHIGYKNPNQNDSEKIVYAMDFILGLESIVLDKDDRRREMYGKAGCFRFKSYGVEYRTLSNFWIANDSLINWAYLKTMQAINLANSEGFDNLVETFKERVKFVIDTNDKMASLQLLNEIEKATNSVLIK